MSRAALNCVKIATPSLTIGGIQSATPSPGIEERIRTTGGGVDPTVSHVIRQQPRIDFTTLHVATVLAALGINGTECTTAETYWNLKANYGTRAAGANHEKVALAKAFAIPRTLQFDRREDASLAMSLRAMSADGSCPLSHTASVSLPGGEDVSEVFTVAKLVLTIAASPITFEIDDGSLDFGIVERMEGVGVYDTECWIEKRNPVISINTPNVSHFATITEDGCQSTAGVLWLRQREAYGTHYADNVAKHLKISWYSSQVIARDISGSDAIQLPVEIHPLYNGTNPILTIAVDQTIT